MPSNAKLANVSVKVSRRCSSDISGTVNLIALPVRFSRPEHRQTAPFPCRG